MGGMIVLPEPDDRMISAMVKFDLKPKDIAKFWKAFVKLDAQKTGLVEINYFFDYINVERSPFTDQLLELVDIDFSGIPHCYACIQMGFL
jgi:hypothetical protein